MRINVLPLVTECKRNCQSLGLPITTLGWHTARHGGQISHCRHGGKDEPDDDYEDD